MPVSFTHIDELGSLVGDVSVVTSIGQDTVVPGGTITYSVVVSNTGGWTSSYLSQPGIVVTDLFPVALTGVTYTSVTTGGATGNTASGSGDIHDTVTMPVGSTITYTVTGTLDPTATGMLSNTATVSLPANDVDTNPANNSSTVTQTINSEADLSITNSANPVSVTAGGTVTYTLAANLLGGNSNALQVVLTDTLPAQTTFVSFTAPAGWTVSAPPIGGVGTVTAGLDTLAQGRPRRSSRSSSGSMQPRRDPSPTPRRSVRRAPTATRPTIPPTPSPPSRRTCARRSQGRVPACAAVVTVFDQSTGEVRLSFLAYNESFHGGVRVAMGDVTGDGVPDIITGAGPGGGPHVRVFDGVNGQQLAGPLGSFFAFDSSFTGGVFVASGDVNGDGRADVIVGAGAGGGPHVKVFSGADGSLLASFYAYIPTFRGGVTVAAGDMTGDGMADIVTGAGAGGGPHVKVFSGADLSTVASFYAYPSTFRGGVTVAAGDFNGDGKADIVTGAGPGGSPQVKAFDGAALALGGSAADNAIANPLTSFYAYAPSFLGGVTVAVTNRGGTGTHDIVTGTGPGGGPQVKVFDGLMPDSLDSFYAFDPTFLGGVYVG